MLFTVRRRTSRCEIYYNDKLFLVPAAGGPARVLLPDVHLRSRERVVEQGRQEHLLHREHGRSQRAHARGRRHAGRLTQLTKGDHSLGGWSFVGRRRAARVHAQHADRAERDLHAAAAGGAQPKRVTAVFDEDLAKFKTARQERITWKGQDGVDGRRAADLPGRLRAGHAVSADRADARRPGGVGQVRLLARDDPGLCRAKATRCCGRTIAAAPATATRSCATWSNGYFKQSHLDVMTGTDAVIAMGVADPAKLVKMGWSAGGHMTNKIITFTDRFKAASSGAGAANWISMYAQSDHREFRTPWFGGTPWQANAPIDLYWNHSPLKDVSKVKTPTIFLVGEQDPRVPMPQSVEMFRALKSNGVPTHLYVAPREGHGWTELRHRLFKLQIEMEWFEKYIHNRAYTWEKVPGDEKKDPRRRSPRLPAS